MPAHVEASWRLAAALESLARGEEPPADVGDAAAAALRCGDLGPEALAGCALAFAAAGAALPPGGPLPAALAAALRGAAGHLSAAALASALRSLAMLGQLDAATRAALAGAALGGAEVDFAVVGG